MRSARISVFRPPRRGPRDRDFPRSPAHESCVFSAISRDTSLLGSSLLPRYCTSNDTERQLVAFKRGDSRAARRDIGEEKREHRNQEKEDEDARITGSRGAFSFQRTKRSFSGLRTGTSRFSLLSSLSLFLPVSLPLLQEETFHGETLFHPIQSLCLHRTEVDGPLTQFFKWIADAARVLPSPPVLFSFRSCLKAEWTDLLSTPGARRDASRRSKGAFGKRRINIVCTLVQSRAPPGRRTFASRVLSKSREREALPYIGRGVRVRRAQNLSLPASELFSSGLLLPSRRMIRARIAPRPIVSNGSAQCSRVFEIRKPPPPSWRFRECSTRTLDEIRTTLAHSAYKPLSRGERIMLVSHDDIVAR